MKKHKKCPKKFDYFCLKYEKSTEFDEFDSHNKALNNEKWPQYNCYQLEFFLIFLHLKSKNSIFGRNKRHQKIPNFIKNWFRMIQKILQIENIEKILIVKILLGNWSIFARHFIYLKSLFIGVLTNWLCQ